MQENQTLNTKYPIPKTQYLKPITHWLYACCALIFCVIIIGGLTRLTGSGLSITRWDVFKGAVPPLTQSAWRELFDLYRQSPQFQKENFWMELEDFEFIFFWEWLHRLIARLIGLAYIVPFFWFWLRGAIPKGYGLKLFSLCLLVLLQGLAGWLMVASGLVNRPSVSHYGLAIHLILALLLYGSSLWLALSLSLPGPQNNKGDRYLRLHTIAALICVTLTIIWGAFTAGLHGGLVYNDSFPLMGGHIAPPTLPPGALSLAQTPEGAQFVHRWLAMTTGAILLGLWLHGRRRGYSFPALHALAAMVPVQIGLGIATLFSGVGLPLAAAHQIGAVAVVTLLLVSARRIV